MDEHKEYLELLEKWKNFSKVYDAIHRAYRLGYEEGAKDGRYSERMARAEMIDINNRPSAE
jgi:hypothetical protein